MASQNFTEILAHVFGTARRFFPARPQCVVTQCTLDRRPPESRYDWVRLECLPSRIPSSLVNRQPICWRVQMPVTFGPRRPLADEPSHPALATGFRLMRYDLSSVNPGSPQSNSMNSGPRPFRTTSCWGFSRSASCDAWSVYARSTCHGVCSRGGARPFSTVYAACR